MFIVIHRQNRREPCDVLRLCRRVFADEEAANDFAWRKARSGALIIRRVNGQTEARYGNKPSSPHRCAWMPLTRYRRVQGDPWGEHTIGIPLDILYAVAETPRLRCNSEG